jgi:hypothetical protein
MGLITAGISQDISLALAELGGARAFVETGTYHGETTRWAATHFKRVHTIERAEALHAEAARSLADCHNVRTHLGDSRLVLPGILHQLGSAPALFWLDGHWSGGLTAGEGDECPLLDELRLLQGRTGDIILIDDARFFLAAPPGRHDPRQWPTMVEIVHALPGHGTGVYLQVIDDVIFIVPREPALMQRLTEYARGRPRAFQEPTQPVAASQADVRGVGRGWRRVLGLR